MADYTTTALVKSALGVTESTWDADIDASVTTASLAIDAHCRRSFSQDAAVSARVYRPDTPCLTAVQDISTTTGLIIETDDNDDGTFETTWAASDYELEPLNGVVGGLTGWPYTTIRAVNTRTFSAGRRATLKVTAKWGWAAVPTPVATAAKLLAIDLWKRKDATWGIVGGAEFGGIRVSRELFNQVGGLLAPYRLGPVVI